MPYKDPQKQKESAHNHYLQNKGKYALTNKKKRDRSRSWLVEYKSALVCSECGEEHPACLEFHHVDSTEKEYGIAKMASDGYLIESILREIEKCIVLCSNCHKKLHWNEKHGSFV